MKLEIQQEKLKLYLEYKVIKDDEVVYIGEVNRMLLPKFRKISFSDINGKEVCTLVQEDIKTFILSKIPIINWFRDFSCPYNLYFNGINSGFLREVQLGKKESPDIYGEVDKRKYSIYMHTGNEYSIFIDDIQECLISQEHWKLGDGDIYNILYSRNLKDELAAIICILIDILWATIDISASSLSYQKTWVIGGRKKDENWKPED
jgi:hypothetical protein